MPLNSCIEQKREIPTFITLSFTLKIVFMEYARKGFILQWEQTCVEASTNSRQSQLSQNKCTNGNRNVSSICTKKLFSTVSLSPLDINLLKWSRLSLRPKYCFASWDSWMIFFCVMTELRNECTHFSWADCLCHINFVISIFELVIP